MGSGSVALTSRAQTLPHSGFDHTDPPLLLTFVLRSPLLQTSFTTEQGLTPILHTSVPTRGTELAERESAPGVVATTRLSFKQERPQEV